MRRSPRVEQAEALLLHVHVHVHVVTASITLCRPYRVAASITYGCSLEHLVGCEGRPSERTWLGCEGARLRWGVAGARLRWGVRV